MGRHITAQRQLGRRRSSELFQRTLRTRKPRFGVLDLYMSLGGIAETFLYFEGTGRLSQPRTKYLQNPCQSLGTVKGSVAAELTNLNLSERENEKPFGAWVTGGDRCDDGTCKIVIGSSHCMAHRTIKSRPSI